MADSLEKKIERLKKKRKSKVHHIKLETLDELEIETPTQYYVLGVDKDGYLIIGRTGWSPRFIEVQTILDGKINIPAKVINELRIGKGTEFKRAKVYTIGRDILIRPIRMPPEWDGRHCSYCGTLIEEVPRNYKPCTMRALGVKFAFCSKTHRRMFREEKIGGGSALKYSDLIPSTD